MAEVAPTPSLLGQLSLVLGLFVIEARNCLIIPLKEFWPHWYRLPICIYLVFILAVVSFLAVSSEEWDALLVPLFWPSFLAFSISLVVNVLSTNLTLCGSMSSNPIAWRTSLTKKLQPLRQKICLFFLICVWWKLTLLPRILT